MSLAIWLSIIGVACVGKLWYGRCSKCWSHKTYKDYERKWHCTNCGNATAVFADNRDTAESTCRN